MEKNQLTLTWFNSMINCLKLSFGFHHVCYNGKSTYIYFYFCLWFKTGQAGSGDFQRYLFISSKLAEFDAMVDMIKDVELF